jgi:hypothetical protein
VRRGIIRAISLASAVRFHRLVFKLIEEAEKTWRRINGPEQIKLLLEGIAFKYGTGARRSTRSAETRSPTLGSGCPRHADHCTLREWYSWFLRYSCKSLIHCRYSC